MELRRLTPAVCLSLALACGSSEEAPAPTPSAPAPPAAKPAPPAAPSGPAAAPAAAADLPHGLLLALSAFGKTPDGKPLPRSELVILTRAGGAWKAESLDDPDSNVFHKAMVYTPPGASPGILTLGGTRAILKLWRRGESGLEAQETLWEDDFGGRFSRMRDAEVAELFGDGVPSLAVATHDQGVVATVRPVDGGFQAERIDEEKNIFVHEIEVGDLDGDGTIEVYATPSAPNKLDGTPQPGKVVRYVPAKGEGRVVVADLGDRHAKEILVSDVDGDGRDELYVSVEAVEGGKLTIQRYDADTDPTSGKVIATLDDTMCRFLTAGDLDGDGKREMVAAAKDTGLWLLRPTADGPWTIESIDRDSKGFEHAALLADLDGDGVDELYVASDNDLELRRYVLVDGKFAREVIYARDDPSPIFTWNLATVPVELVQ